MQHRARDRRQLNSTSPVVGVVGPDVRHHQLRLVVEKKVQQADDRKKLPISTNVPGKDENKDCGLNHATATTADDESRMLEGRMRENRSRAAELQLIVTRDKDRASPVLARRIRWRNHCLAWSCRWKRFYDWRVVHLLCTFQFDVPSKLLRPSRVQCYDPMIQFGLVWSNYITRVDASALMDIREQYDTWRLEWAPQIHYLYPSALRNRVHMTLLSWKRICPKLPRDLRLQMIRVFIIISLSWNDLNKPWS